MQSDIIVFSIFLIFTGAAVFAGAALYLRQSMLVAYIALGCLAGPWGIGLVTESTTIQGIGHVGIIFLLYLLGLNLHPQKLLQMLREATRVTLLSSLAFAIVGYLVALIFGFSTLECFLIGAAMMFSSTIIGLKLLPTTALHHRHVGEVIISVLLLQDIIAILILLLLEGLRREALDLTEAALLVVSLPALAAFAFLFERHILLRIIRRFDTIQEFVFLVAIGWCLGIAQLGHTLGLSYEMGAFIAGVALATSPIATFIAESLKPLRDFFLITFFFSLGAGFDLSILPAVAAPAVALAILMLVLKPFVFKALLEWEGEETRLGREIGVRLGQVSEFSLLIALLAVSGGVIGAKASYLIQAATLLTFIGSSYLIMFRYPTPIAVSESLRRD
ncbi:MAG: cation:proton antiporter [Gammaproteobacteria bacterium]|nr:cation:proton antiporter [Gammaproteobacteria bacterium]NIM73787.1 cation:proton antiporter [Gammaproteobacteria bacterium]NIN39364.1 cation:proton antiporter [Gammaproteobacteria bacterium]NIO25029.1 cation:proton antiporter [Gammaproteobacteria bacterium]NIO65661.1 cation:proton antiporter [Gammaproteobacteria bacterium]